MGLAVLPARLKDELADIKSFLIGDANEVAPYHQQWTEQLKDKYAEFSSLDQIEPVLEKELGHKFAKVLGDAGVFKEQHESERFIKILNK